jgi:hypothetical protein
MAEKSSRTKKCEKKSLELKINFWKTIGTIYLFNTLISHSISNMTISGKKTFSRYKHLLDQIMNYNYDKYLILYTQIREEKNEVANI